MSQIWLRKDPRDPRSGGGSLTHAHGPHVAQESRSGHTKMQKICWSPGLRFAAPSPRTPLTILSLCLSCVYVHKCMKMHPFSLMLNTGPHSCIWGGAPTIQCWHWLSVTDSVHQVYKCGLGLGLVLGSVYCVSIVASEQLCRPHQITLREYLSLTRYSINQSINLYLYQVIKTHIAKLSLLLRVCDAKIRVYPLSFFIAHAWKRLFSCCQRYIRDSTRQG